MENITPKEWAISIVVLLVALALAVVVEPTLKDHMLDEIRTYEQALRVENDPGEYAYAKKTNVGNVLAYGELSALEPQSIPELSQSYAMIEKVKEHYTMHVRTVCQTVNKQTTCHPETYWTWDVVQCWSTNCQNYAFLGATFQLEQLDLSAFQRLTLTDQTMAAEYSGYYDQWNLYPDKSIFGQPSGSDRFYFVVLPEKFQATIFSKFLDDKVTEPMGGGSRLHVFYGTTPEQVVQGKKDDLVIFDILYYILSLVVAGGLYFLWAYSYVEIE